MTRAEHILEMYRDVSEGAGAKAAGGAALAASGYGIYKKHFDKAKEAVGGKEGVKNVARNTASRVSNVMQSDRARELGNVMRHLNK